MHMKIAKVLEEHHGSNRFRDGTQMNIKIGKSIGGEIGLIMGLIQKEPNFISLESVTNISQIDTKQKKVLLQKYETHFEHMEIGGASWEQRIFRV